jgi:phosphoribosylformylglycinamidine synthase
VLSAHDVSDGGLAVALAECCITSPSRTGVRVTLGDRIRPDALLFGESTGRVIVTSRDVEALHALADQHGIPCTRIGETGGPRFTVCSDEGEAWIDLDVEQLRSRWERAIPRRLENA